MLSACQDGTKADCPEGRWERTSLRTHARPTEASRSTAHVGGKRPTAWQGCARHTPRGRAGQWGASQRTASYVPPSESWGGTTSLGGCGRGPLWSSLPRCHTTQRSNVCRIKLTSLVCETPWCRATTLGTQLADGRRPGTDQPKGLGHWARAGPGLSWAGTFLHTGVGEPVFHPQEGR